MAAATWDDASQVIILSFSLSFVIIISRQFRMLSSSSSLCHDCQYCLPGPRCSSTKLCRSPSRGGREQRSGNFWSPFAILSKFDQLILERSSSYMGWWQYSQFFFPQENIILAYDTADDSDDATLDYSDSEQRDASDDFSEVEDYSDVQIDWSAWISSMPDPVLLD